MRSNYLSKPTAEDRLGLSACRAQRRLNKALDHSTTRIDMLENLASTMSLKGVLDGLKPYGWEHVDHWAQGEFHHDVVLRVRDVPPELPGGVIVVSTNCNGGVKEVLCLADIPDRWGLWYYRCPENPEFEGPAPEVRGFARTVHWFNPCELLKPGTRSEYREEFRRRQRGGGYVCVDASDE